MRQRAASALPALAQLALALSLTLPGIASAQKRSRAPVAAHDAPPHAWLFGTWTGGLFPVLNWMAAQD